MPPPITTASADFGRSSDVWICCSGARMSLSVMELQSTALRRQPLLQLSLEQNFIPVGLPKSRVPAFQAMSVRMDWPAGCGSVDGCWCGSILCCGMYSAEAVMKLDRIDIKILHELQKN